MANQIAPEDDAGYPAAIGGRLRDAIEATGNSLSEVARACDVSPQRLNNWLRGDHYPDLLFLRRFCARYRISTDQILLPGSDPARRIELAWSDDGAEEAAERAALAAAIDESDADPRTVSHEKARAWMLRLIAGEIDAPPPEPD